MRHTLPALLVAAALFVAARPAIAAEGTALGVDPDALARAGGQDRILVVGADISVGERIVTGAEGLVQILFADETKLVVGPGSSLLIEEFLLRGESTAGKVTINALAGTFRFISGKSPKDVYEVKTPTGTIGVRGTAYDLTVFDFGSYLLLLNGALTACNLQNICIDITDRCEIGAFDSSQAVVIGTEGDRDQFLQTFPYARFQSMLLGKFRVTGAGQCVFADAQTPGAGSLNDPLIGGTDPKPGAAPPDPVIEPEPDPIPDPDPDPTPDPGPGPGKPPGRG